MLVKIHPTWFSVLKDEFEQSYFKQLTDFVWKEYQQHRCYPRGNQIFSAFDYCTFDKIKVVIIGQDPYHGEGQANGLCFSVSDGQPHPRSLVNILKEVSIDCQQDYPKNGNLDRWARQGVLLLNATLTVQANKAGSHQGQGWEVFTDSIIRIISEQYEHIVFMLWGTYAKQKVNLIDSKKHFILCSGHPSPLSANRGLWFGNKHFSQCNNYLATNGRSSINW